MKKTARVLYRKLSNISVQNTYEKYLSDSQHLELKILCTIEKILDIRLRIEQVEAFLYLIKEKIVELQTGGGKTFILACAAAYLSLKYKKSVHIIVFNDYLAERDYKQMKKFFDELKLSASYLSEDDSSSRHNTIQTNDVIYSSIDNLIYTSTYKPFSKNFILIDEIDGIVMDKNSIPHVIKTDDENNKQKVEKIFKNFDLIEKLVNSNYLKKYKDYFCNSDQMLFLYKGACTKLNYIMLKYTKKVMDIYDISLLQIGLITKHFYKLDENYSIENGQIVFIDQIIGRYNALVEFGNGIHNYLRKTYNLEINYKTSIYISFESILHFILHYSFITGVSGTILTEQKAIKLFFNKEVVKVGKEPKITVKYLILKNDYEYLNYLFNTINVQPTRPVIIVEQTMKNAKNTFEYLKYYFKNTTLLIPNNEQMQDEIINDSGKIRSILISTNMLSRGIDIKSGGNHPHPHTLHGKFINKIYKAKGEQINKLGGILLIYKGMSINTRVDLQVMGRTGRNDNLGEVINIITKEDHIYKKTLSYSNHSLKSLDPNFMINKMIQTQLIMNNRYLEDSLHNLDDIFFFNSLLKSLNYSKSLIQELVLTIKYFSNLLSQTDRREILKRYFVYNYSYYKYYFELKNNDI